MRDYNGHYDFGSEFRLAETDHDARAERFEADFGVGTFGAELETRDHEGYYAPDEVVVVTSEGTMSSAFAGAALLSELGADLVGVPSGQAPVSFGETVERTLPNTGLTVGLSGSMYRWVPDPSGTVLPMDRELTPDVRARRSRRRGRPGMPGRDFFRHGRTDICAHGRDTVNERRTGRIRKRYRWTTPSNTASTRR